ncbi:MAG: glycogen debranching enzyme N-terminal domain-containing protein, partial [Desulfobacterales bacterium]
MKISFDQNITQNFSEAICREWIETNGLGGWASSTIIGANTRRYHGVLVVDRPTVGRMVLLSKLDETIETDDQRFELSTNIYPGAIHPQGFRYLQKFSKSLFPTFTFELAGIRLQKTIAGVYSKNMTLILYKVIYAPSSFILEFRPFVAGRDYHSLMHANNAINWDFSYQEEIFSARPYEGLPELFIHIPGALFEADQGWYYNFEYPVEKFRGLDFQEDLFTYGVFKCNLRAGDDLGVVVSTHNPNGLDAFVLFDKEKERRQGLSIGLKVVDEISTALTLAADQFIVTRGNDSKTIIAGYHWFSDWGRDTMISLPGLTLATKRFNDAKEIIRTFAQSVSQGMIPNRFPETGEEPEYNTADATLWFFVAIFKYLRHTGDKEFVKDEVMPVLQDIIEWHERGTRYNIHVDNDGLLYGGEPGVQLTWMDAKIGDYVVTPRTGKAVEINALWCNALAIFASLSKYFDQMDQARHYAKKTFQVKKRFEEVFWYEKGGYLYDFIDGDTCDTSIRPNQIFALCLPYQILEGEKAKRVLQVIEDHLLTPFGLRSLAPQDPKYRSLYTGSSYQRDSAYHQGPVWSWLLG